MPWRSWRIAAFGLIVIVAAGALMDGFVHLAALLIESLKDWGVVIVLAGLVAAMTAFFTAIGRMSREEE